MQQPQTYQVEGILYDKMPPYHGEKIVTREFVLKVLRYTKQGIEYYAFPKFKCIKWPNTRPNYDTVKQLDEFFATEGGIREGDILKVSFQLDGSSYEKDGKKGYMTSLVVKKLELLLEFSTPGKESKEKPSTTEMVNDLVDGFNIDETDDLPFNVGSR